MGSTPAIRTSLVDQSAPALPSVLNKHERLRWKATLAPLGGDDRGFPASLFVDPVVVFTWVLGQHLRHDVGEVAAQNGLRTVAH